MKEGNWVGQEDKVGTVNEERGPWDEGGAECKHVKPT